MGVPPPYIANASSALKTQLGNQCCPVASTGQWIAGMAKPGFPWVSCSDLPTTTTTTKEDICGGNYVADVWSEVKSFEISRPPQRFEILWIHDIFLQDVNFKVFDIETPSFDDRHQSLHWFTPGEKKNTNSLGMWGLSNFGTNCHFQNLQSQSSLFCWKRNSETASPWLLAIIGTTPNPPLSYPSLSSSVICGA